MTTKRTVGPATTGAASGVGVAGALTIVLFWILGGLWGIEAPADVQSAVTILIAFGGALVGGWLSPAKDKPSTVIYN